MQHPGGGVRGACGHREAMRKICDHPAGPAGHPGQPRGPRAASGKLQVRGRCRCGPASSGTQCTRVLEAPVTGRGREGGQGSDGASQIPGSQGLDGSHGTPGAGNSAPHPPTPETAVLHPQTQRGGQTKSQLGPREGLGTLWGGGWDAARVLLAPHRARDRPRGACGPPPAAPCLPGAPPPPRPAPLGPGGGGTARPAWLSWSSLQARGARGRAEADGRAAPPAPTGAGGGDAGAEAAGEHVRPEGFQHGGAGGDGAGVALRAALRGV